MKSFLALLGIILITLQIGSLFYAISNGINPLDVMFGFALWGCIPVWLVLSVSKETNP